MTIASQVRGRLMSSTLGRAVALGVRRIGVRSNSRQYVSAGQRAVRTSANRYGQPGTPHNCNHNCNHDSGAVRWYAERHCHGDVLIARRVVARWSAADAARRSPP